MMNSIMISLIAAVSKNRVIGRQGKIPWHLPDDLKRFKALTLGHPIIMGRKTYESLGRALPGRTNIVLSRAPDFSPPDCRVARSWGEALDFAEVDNEVFVIGGEAVYREVMPRAGRMYLTHVDVETDGDAFFPEFSEKEWRIVSREEHEKDSKNPFSYIHITYERTA